MAKQTKTERQKAVAKADTAWAKAVKRKFNYTCQKPGCKTRSSYFDSHHAVLPRGAWGARFDINNGLCLHKGCHKYWAHVHHEQCREVMLALLGTDGFRQIKSKERSIVKYSIKDLYEIAEQLDKMYTDVSPPKKRISRLNKAKALGKKPKSRYGKKLK